MKSSFPRPRWSTTLSVVSLLLVGGCPGSIEDPAAFEQFPTCPGNIDVERLFVSRCGSSICHGGAGGAPQGGLDLTTPPVSNFLLTEAGEAEHSCGGMPLIDLQNPGNSYLLAKIEGPPASCGDRMPLFGSLSRDEIQCIRSYVYWLAAQPIPDAGMPDAGTDAGSAGTDAGSDAAIDAGIDGGP